MFLCLCQLYVKRIVTTENTYFVLPQKGADFVVLDANHTSDGKDYDHGNFNWTDANIPPEELDWLKKGLYSL